MELSGNTTSLSPEDKHLLELLKPESGHIFTRFHAGRSGATVLVIDLRGQGELQGPHVAKIQDVENGEEENIRHNRARQTLLSPHIPKIVDSVSENGRVVTLYKLAGGHLLNIQPLDYLIKTDVARAVEFITITIDLLMQLNPLEKIISKRYVSKVSSVLKNTINIGKERLKGPESISNRLAGILPLHDKPSIIFEGADTILPNPIAYAYQDDLWEEKQLIFTDGFIHADFHSDNIVCDLRTSNVLIIDWGAFEEQGLSFFDWAYLEIDLILRFLPCKSWEDWGEWLFLTEFVSTAILPEGEPRGRLSPMVWRLLRPIRNNVQSIINNVPFELREWVEISFLLSNIAASLNFIRKKTVSRQDKTALLLYGARCLERVRKELNIRRPTVPPSYISLPREMEDINWEDVGIASQSGETSSTSGTDIFLSYAHEDFEIASRIAEDLRGRGYSVWYDQAELKGGEEWVRTITRGINLAPIFISLISSASNESVWVRREFLYAEKKGKKVIPIVVENCEVPIYILEKQVVDLKSTYRIGLRTLVDLLPPPIDRANKREEWKFARRLLEQAYLDRLLFKYEVWKELYTPMSGVAEGISSASSLKLPVSPAVMNPLFELIKERRAELGGYSNQPYKVTSILMEIKARRRVVLLGDPGGGKSTSMWRLASDLAIDCLNNATSPLPLLVPMGGYSGNEIFIDYIQSNAETLLGELSIHLPDLLQENRIALLLDGLNEMPRSDYEDRVLRVKEFLEKYSNVIAVVTCRELDYTVDLDLDRIRISPLDPIQIKAFLRNYLKEDGENLFWKLIDKRAENEYWPRFQQAGGNEYDFWLAEEEPTGLSAPWYYWDWAYWLKIRDNPRSYLGIARNPFMLYMIAQVYATHRSLPNNRGQLFRLFVDVLIAQEHKKCREEDWVDEKIQRENLSHLAFSMQKGGKSGTSVDRETALSLLGGEKMLHLAASENLLQVGEHVRFTHQLLQEFFAAYALDQERLKGKPATEFWPSTQWWKPVGWEETSVLLAGLYNDDPLAVLNWLRDSNPELAARCLIDGGINIKDSVRQMLIAAWLPRLTDLSEPVLARAAIGRALGLVEGDSRPGVCLVDDNDLPVIEWCDIPAGDFISGDDYQQRINLSSYRMSKYLITNAQFDTFIRDKGYTDKWRRCWTKSGWEQKGDRIAPEDYSETHNLPNHPRIGINWYEAVAYCNWLNIRLRTLNRLPEGFEIRLPTEMEWEKVARGTDGRIYPWGNEFDKSKCNVIEIESTTAVGIFPDGASPYGVMDVVGNAWKWCLTKWRDDLTLPEDNGLEGNTKRCYRGGSWGSNVWRSAPSECTVPVTSFITAYTAWGHGPINSIPWTPIELHCGKRYWIVPEDDRPDAIGFFIVLGPILQK